MDYIWTQIVALTILLTVCPGTMAKPRFSLHKESTPAEPSGRKTIPSIIGHTYSENQINSCIEKTCGPASSNIGADNAFSQTFQSKREFQELWSDLESKIKARVETQAAQDIKLMGRVKQFFNEKPKIKISPGPHALLAWAKIHTLVDNHISEFLNLDLNTNIATLNEKKFKKLTVHQTPATVEALRRYLTQWWGQALNKPLPTTTFDNPLNLKLRSYYPGIPIEQALKNYAQRELSRLTRLRKILPMIDVFIDAEDSEQLLAKAAAGGDLSKAESEQLEHPTLFIDMFTEVTSGDLYQALLAIPIDTNFIYKHEFQNRFLGRPGASVVGDSISETMTKVGQFCKPRIAELMQANATADQHEKFKLMLSDVQAAAQRVATRLVAPSEADDIIKAIQNATFEYSEKASEKIERFKLNIAKSNGNTNLFMGNDASANEMVAVFLIMMGPDYSTETTNEAEELCNNLSASTISDYALSATGRIGVSWFTVAYPDVGIGIIAHELGHVTSFNLRQMANKNQNSTVGFSNSLSCVAQRNPFFLNVSSLREMDKTTWSEEDWADHFSSMVLNELEAAGSKWMSGNRNKGCALVTNFGGYTSNTLQPWKGDPHSSGFLRLLMIGYDRGNLDPVCTPFLDYANTSSRNLNCH